MGEGKSADNGAGEDGLREEDIKRWAEEECGSVEKTQVQGEGENCSWSTLSHWRELVSCGV